MTRHKTALAAARAGGGTTSAGYGIFRSAADVCVETGDTTDDVGYLARKTARLRIFEDDAGKMNRAVGDVGGAVLAVSQFTLAAETRRGNRPSFANAAEPNVAEALFDAYCVALAAEGVPVERGRFAAHMTVALENDGPVTIWLEARAR